MSKFARKISRIKEPATSKKASTLDETSPMTTYPLNRVHSAVGQIFTLTVSAAQPISERSSTTITQSCHGLHKTYYKSWRLRWIWSLAPSMNSAKTLSPFYDYCTTHLSRLTHLKTSEASAHILTSVVLHSFYKTTLGAYRSTTRRARHGLMLCRRRARMLSTSAT